MLEYPSANFGDPLSSTLQNIPCQNLQIILVSAGGGGDQLLPWQELESGHARNRRVAILSAVSKQASTISSFCILVRSISHRAITGIGNGNSEPCQAPSQNLSRLFVSGAVNNFGYRCADHQLHGGSADVSKVNAQKNRASPANGSVVALVEKLPGLNYCILWARGE